MRGGWWVAAIRAATLVARGLGAPKGLIDPGEGVLRTALREMYEETGSRGPAGEARRHPLRLHVGRRAGLQDRQLLPPPRTRRAGSARSSRRWRSRSTRPAGSRSTRRRAPRVQGRAPDGLGEAGVLAEGSSASGRGSSRRSANLRAQLLFADRRRPAPLAARRRRSASATSPRKYKKGMVVHVLVGARYGPREKVFDAVIDKVEVKRLSELSPRESSTTTPRRGVPRSSRSS